MTNKAPEPALDFAPGDHRAGFRLQRFEVYNWGTFHNRVWILRPDGDNSLLTGDIGSGKSTLVDALTTLLVPAQRIIYNKAAGAESRERSLRSYVLGYYKSERGEPGLSAKAVALRDHNSYSVILGHFFNEGYGRDVTLAQVFWMRDTQGQPARFYVVADRPLAIAEDFAGFGPEIQDLRKRLRRQPKLEIFESFPPYGAAFRRRFGIENEQALELFNQTVSMKSVGNLTDFVRGHMLEPFAVQTRIEALIAHFDDLDRAHQAVLKAKVQIQALTPLVGDVGRYHELAAHIEEMRACREALRPWFAQLKGELLQQRLDRLDRDWERLSGRIERLEEQRQDQLGRRDSLKQAIAENGGDRLEQLKSEIERHVNQQEERRSRAQAYQVLTEALSLSWIADETGFLDSQRQAAGELSTMGDARDALQNELTETSVVFRGLRDRHNELQTELVSLRSRRSNVPAVMLALRERLCARLNLPAETLPFAGELIEVREKERDWEGVIERLMHNFGLSLLIPDTNYREVAEWVDRTHLGGRLVYYRVRESRKTEQPELLGQSLMRKLAIHPESTFYGWLERELARRFDYACCKDMDQFRREQKAVTRAGQIKGAFDRHEKDDRHAIDDRSRYILGWDNRAKIAALEKQNSDLETQLHSVAEKIAGIQQEQKRLREREGLLHQIAVYREFRDLDWRPLTVEIQRLAEERKVLESASDLLRTLQEQLSIMEETLRVVENEWVTARDERSRIGEKRERSNEQQAEAVGLLALFPEEHRARYFPQLETMRLEAIGLHKLTVESCDNSQTELRDWLQRRIDSEDARIKKLRDRIIDAMRQYRTDFPLESSEVDVSVEAAGEYGAMLDRLEADDLPRFESQFKTLLNENTIREVAGFQAELHREREEIRERIETINRSLRQIDYNPNRYITLLAEPTQDPEIRYFREALKACTEGSLTGSENEQYSEAKFLQVKAIIERFRGRQGQTETDVRWTRQVTDVRHWFVFSASERWREDDSEYEHYTDSGGKSGGQKEKLAYTVLAASLAYQFGLEWGEQRSRSFRFVVIDEAFARGSDESTHYGLELFKRLNLQLLIVTPLQKIHVIEPFVASVGFVHNEDGRRSMLRTLTVEEYRAEQAARKLITVS